MSNMMGDAFHFALAFNRKKMKIFRPTMDEKDVWVTPSNYFRNLAMPEEIVSEGREYIVSKKDLLETGYQSIKRGDKFIDPDFGVNSVVEIRDILILGEVLGFRIRLE